MDTRESQDVNEHTLMPNAKIERVHPKHLRAALLAVLPFACADKTREHIWGVLIERDADELNIVATQGYVIARATITPHGSSSGRLDRIVLSDPSARALADALKFEKSPTDASMELDHFEYGHVRVPAIPACRYLAYREVIPPQGRDVSVGDVGLNYTYLEAAAKACRVFVAARHDHRKRDIPPLLVSRGGPIDPVRLDVGDPEIGRLTIVIGSVPP
jgi:hypothetical protein